MRSSGLLLVLIVLVVSLCLVPANADDHVANNPFQEKIKQSLGSMNVKRRDGKSKQTGAAQPQKKGIPGGPFSNVQLNSRQRFENLAKLKKEHGGIHGTSNPAKHETKFQQFQEKMKNLFKGVNRKDWKEKLQQKQDL